MAEIPFLLKYSMLDLLLSAFYVDNWYLNHD